jgi:hypothetical protein
MNSAQKSWKWFVHKVHFSDEVTFHINGQVHDLGTEILLSPISTTELKSNVFCDISKEKLYRHMLTLWLLSKLHKDSNNFIFKQVGVLPYFYVSVWKPECTLSLKMDWSWRNQWHDSCRWPMRSP